MNTLRAVGFCAMLMLGLGTQAMADCFDYRSDVHSAWETIGSLKEKGTEEVRGRITEDTPQVRKRVWVGKTDFIAVQFSGNFEPVMVVTQPEEGTPLTQGWMKDDENGNKIPYPLGHFFIAIDVEGFLGLDVFKRVAGDILRKLRNSEKMPGADQIYTAGEKEHEAWLYRKDKGAKVDKKLQQELVEVRDRFNLPYTFDFEK